MTSVRGPRSVKGRVIRSAGSAAAAAMRLRNPKSYRPGVTVVTVTWNSLPFLSGMLDATRAMSPDAAILVVDNASSDGTRDFLRRRDDVRVLRLPVNVGHGVALDLAVQRVDTEFLAILDVDAFPVSSRWLRDSVGALDEGAKIAGAHMHRNYVHPCFLVTSTPMLHEHGLTFRPVGSLARLSDRMPLFLDVGEALSQRAIVKYGGGQALHFFEVTSIRGPGNVGMVFGNLVYHNGYATQGAHQAIALETFREQLSLHHANLIVDRR